MTPEIVDRLKSHADPDIEKLKTRVNSLLQQSRSWMDRYHKRWDKGYETYRSELKIKQQDRKTRKDEPEKVAMPTLLSQVETITTFFSEALTQEEIFFQVKPTGPEDIEGAKLAGPLLEKDLNRAMWRGVVLPAAAKDLVICNLCAFYVTWVEKKGEPTSRIVPVLDENGIQIDVKEEFEENILDQYNLVKNISPYHVFPDPRIELVNYQQGEFCAIESVYTKQKLEEMEQQGLLVGVKDASDSQIGMLARKKFDVKDSAHDVAGGDSGLVMTEVQLRLKPKSYGLGDSEEVSLWYVWMLGDRIVRLEEMGYDHNQFTIMIGFVKAASDVYLEDSIADPIIPMQTSINFLLNGRIQNLRQNIRNKWVVDQSAIELSDIDDPTRSYIRLKAVASGVGVDQWIKQVAVADVSQNILSDITTLDGWTKATTGATDTLLGMISTGRRSATEMRAAVSSATSRLKLSVFALWETAIAPMGKQMLMNYRQALVIDTVVRVVGENQQAFSAVPQFINVSRESLPQNSDFTLESTLVTSERLILAQQLKELLQLVLGNPQLLSMFQVDIPKILIDLLTLQGLKHANQYIRPLPPTAPAAPGPVGGVAPPPVNPGSGGISQIGAPEMPQ